MTTYYSERMVGLIVNLAFHVKERGAHSQPAHIHSYLPRYWYSASKRGKIALELMSTPHLVHSLAMLLRSEGKYNPNQGLAMQRALLIEIGKRAPVIGYAGPQRLALGGTFTVDTETRPEPSAWWKY